MNEPTPSKQPTWNDVLAGRIGTDHDFTVETLARVYLDWLRHHARGRIGTSVSIAMAHIDSDAESYGVDRVAVHTLFSSLVRDDLNDALARLPL